MVQNFWSCYGMLATRSLNKHIYIYTYIYRRHDHRLPDRPHKSAMLLGPRGSDASNTDASLKGKMDDATMSLIRPKLSRSKAAHAFTTPLESVVRRSILYIPLLLAILDNVGKQCFGWIGAAGSLEVGSYKCGGHASWKRSWW